MKGATSVVPFFIYGLRRIHIFNDSIQSAGRLVSRVTGNVV